AWRLVKAINTAVDLIVTHFGTNRNPGVKAKLGNSSVSPNVGHIILKYLCPAIRDILQDGLRAYLLDLIIGQRRNQPWSVVEASTQLGPSTRVLHSLFSKVSQYSELTSPNMRLNAFIIVCSCPWSTDVMQPHYHPWGFLVASQGACHALFEELLLLLQPLSLLPFDLDLLFELRLLQKGQEHLRRKAQLCSTRHGLEHSVRSTFQLMRADFWGDSGGRIVRGMQRLTGVGSESLFEQDKEKQDSRNDKEHQPIVDGPRQRDRQAGWWFQLMQSSQVYIDKSTEGSKFVKWERRKKSVLERQADGPVHWNSQPPPREGVVEGAEAFQEQELVKEGSGKSSWMGSPPESVLNELKRSKEKEPEEQRGIAEALEETSRGIYWSRLFGATGDPCFVPTRLPSEWLSLDTSVLDFIAQTIGPGKRPRPCTLPFQEKQALEVPSLGHRVAAEPRGLSFNCEDLLHVLGCSEADWLDYSLGRHTSLVSTVYASLTEEPEGQL
uniref:RUN and SH3 domain containing 2 n=1 Tax=Scleropages formosus TaxID=113540 RepID=A0A8C9WSH9_SCLFO